jgi:secreted Zn-dependent insulinase-like peptidase
MFDACHVEVFALGNTTAEDASRMGECLVKSLKISKVLDTIPERKEAAFLPGSTLWRVKSTDEDDPNNAVKMWMQFENTDETRLMLFLLNNVLGTKFFDELRTQQQIGYIVGMGPSPSTKFCYLQALAQTEFPVDYVRSRIDKFFTEKLEWIQDGLEDVEFSTCREGLLSELKTKPKNLGEEMQHFAKAFNDRTYDFGARKRLIKLLESSVTLSSFKAWMKENVPSAPRLYMQVSKVVEKEDKPLPEGATVPPDPADLTIWTGRDGIVEAFEKATPGWKVWDGSKPDAWKVVEV